MNWFRRKKKVRVYPAVLSEWTGEFARIGTRFLQEQDAVLLSGGALEDQKYSLDGYRGALASFLETQVNAYFAMYSKVIGTCMENFDPTYMVLMIRRQIALYDRLFFFEKLDFLPLKDRERWAGELKEKLTAYHRDLLAYMKKLSENASEVWDVITHIQRLM